MTKQHLIALADQIRLSNSVGTSPLFSTAAINALADFCDAQTPNFDRQRWLDYVNGKSTANGKKLV